jgi:hypothetical protein
MFKKPVFQILTLFAAFLLISQAQAVEDLSSTIYNVEMDSQMVNEIQSYLPENGGLNPAFVSNTTDPNLHLIAEGDVSLTFIDEGAGFKNSFGYFTYDDAGNILSEVTIFSNASETGGGGTLNVGDTVDLGTFAEGTNIGFWLTADGYNGGSNTYYSIDSMNPDGLRHIAILEDPETQQLIIGFEDLYNLGDQDYNDIVFTVNVTPYEALDTSHIPSGAPEASQIATMLIAMLVMLLNRYKSMIRKSFSRPVDATI